MFGERKFCGDSRKTCGKISQIGAKYRYVDGNCVLSDLLKVQIWTFKTNISFYYLLDNSGRIIDPGCQLIQMTISKYPDGCFPQVLGAKPLIAYISLQVAPPFFVQTMGVVSLN
jgi:hypothetical protein